jgi:hypothetical protein
MRYLFLGISLTFSLQLAHSQDFTFKVIGSVFKLYTKEKTYAIGQELNQNDTIILKENNYIALITPQGKMFDLSKPGVYLVSDLEKEVQKKASSTSKIDILLQSEAKLPHSRYFNKITFRNDFYRPFIFFLPYRSKLYRINKIPLSWSKYVREGKKIIYKIDVRNNFDESVATYTTSDTSLVFDYSTFKASEKDETFIIIFVLKVEILDTKEVISGRDEKSLSTLDENELKELKKQYKSLKKIKFSSSLVQKLSEIFLLEKSNCTLEAQILFEELIKNYPQSAILKKSYHLFLFRSGVFADWLDKLYPEE